MTRAAASLRTAPLGPSARWASLPRDARDTLFLLLVVAWIILPLTASLPVWASVIAYAMLAWRAAIAYRQAKLPSRWALAAVLAVVVGLTLWSYRTIVGSEAGVTLVTMLLALKTLELRARRDAMVIFFLGFFALLSNFLHSQSLVTALAIAVGLAGLLTALVNAHMPVGRPSLSFGLGLSLKMVLIGAPLTLALFVFFPRMAPLWGVPNNPNAGKTGLSDEMTVGAMASLAQDDSIAFRVRFLTPGNEPPASRHLYFRGPVLSDFDGRIWRASASIRSKGDKLFQDIATAGDPIRYELTMEPHRKPWLLALDLTAEPPQLPRGRAYSTGDLNWMSSQPINEVTRMQLQSHLQYRFGMQATELELRSNRRLPAQSNPRTQAWVQQLQSKIGVAPDANAQLVQALLTHLRTQGYQYTLDPGVYGREAADEFWFDRKEGFCEHIASAFVIALRSAGVPSRIVTGYQGGENNPVDGFWTVRQADAHAWAEVWLGPQEGWVRIDPTGAVMPGRVGAAQRLTRNSGFFGVSVDNPLAISTMQRMRAVWEAVNNSWNQWVLNYTQREQMNLLQSLGFSSPSWIDLVRILGISILAGMLVVAVLLQRQHRRTDAWLRLLTSARTRLAKAGIASNDSATPRSLAKALRQQYPCQAPLFTAWLQAMEQWRYAAPDDATNKASNLQLLQKQLRQLPWSSLSGTPRKV